MADNTGRDGEEALFEIIRSLHAPDDRNEEDDGSQYLNNTEEGDDMIFDRDNELMKSWTMTMIMMAKKMLILK